MASAAGTNVGRRELERALVARMELQRMRGLRLFHLRVLAVTSLPVWGHALWQALGSWAWLAVLFEGYALVTVLVLAALELRWRLRAAYIGRRTDMALHVWWSSWEDLRSAAWSGLAVVSAVPWLYLALSRPIPGALLRSLLACAVAAFVLVVMVESAPHVPALLAGPLRGDDESQEDDEDEVAP